MLFEIGQEIRRKRKLEKFTQAELAKLLGMSRTTISQIESGIVKEIGVRKLIRLLEILGLKISLRGIQAPTMDELQTEQDK